MRPKTLCFINTNKAWGGGEKWHYEHALLCRDRGYQVCVAANEQSVLADRLEGQPGIDLLRLPVGNLSFLNPARLLRLRDHLREHSVDAAILCLPQDLKLGGLAARLAGVPDIIYRRGIAVTVRDTALNRFLYGRVLTKLIVNSDETRRRVLEQNPNLIAPARIFRIYFGTDVAAYDALPVRPLTTRRGGEVLIGNAARLTPQKGQNLLIETAALLKRQSGTPFRVLIAGTGELEGELRARVRELGLEDVVEFTGFIEDIKSFYAGLDIFALPSLWEGFGQVLSEAMLCRLPVVAWDASSNPEVVEHGRTGLLCPTGDVAALAGALAKLMEDADLRARMGQAGRERVIEHFSLDKTFADFERCLDARP